MMRLTSFNSLMARDRFLNLMSFFHVSNNSAQLPRDHPDFNPGNKVQPLADLIIANWQAHYTPGRELSVDEALVNFKGRVKFLQYIPSKPHKWGMKIWILAESKTGYVYNWSLYTGKAAKDRAGRTATHKLVMDICDPVLDLGHHIYMDNFFTSPALFDELGSRGTGACGTLRLKRNGVPECVKKGVSLKGQSFTHREQNQLFVVWKDKRQVNLLTSVHNSSTFKNRIRSRFAEGHYRTIEKPRAIGLYSMFMGGVDLSDQLNSYHQLSHKQNKWWKKVVFSHLLETSVSNARVVYKHRHKGEAFDVNTFRLDIISGLLEDYEKPSKLMRKPSSDPPDRLLTRDQQHFFSLHPKKPGARVDCVVCSNRPIRRCTTLLWCIKCDKPMCPYPCYQRYHTLQDYKIPCSDTLHKS